MMPPSALAVSILAAGCWIAMISRHALGGHSHSSQPPSAVADDLLNWMLMVGAMMLPTTIPAIDDVMRRSFRRRRTIAAVEFASGYLACWGLVGAIFVLLRFLPQLHDRRIAAAACLLASLWALLPARRIWFAQCHRQIPLCPSGWRADWDAVRQGATQGIPCIKMCWVIMVACGISGHDWGMMIGGTVLALWEKRMFRLDYVPIVLGPLLLLAWLLVQDALPITLDLPSPSHHHH